MFEALTFLVLFAMLHRLHRMHHTLKRTEAKIMALSDDVKALRDEVLPKLDEAIAEINKIDDLLAGGDVAGAQAAIAEIRSKFTDLKTAVDRPEGVEG